MIDVTRLLPRLIRASGNNPELAESAAKIAWTRAAGPGLRRHAAVFRLYRTTLIVSVADAIWQRQLQDMAGELLFRVNRLLGSDAIAFIEFRVDPGTLAELRAEEKTPARKIERPLPAALVSAASSIADKELRDRFVRAAGNCIARRDDLLKSEI